MAFEATLGTLYRWADKVLRLDDTPPRLAAAYAWGITAGFSPFFGIQYLAAFAVAIVFRLNKLLVLAGLCTNLPWIMVPWYTATTAIAGAVLGVPLPVDLRGEFVSLFSQSLLARGFWEHLFHLVRPWLLPFLLGPHRRRDPARHGRLSRGASCDARATETAGRHRLRTPDDGLTTVDFGLRTYGLQTRHACRAARLRISFCSVANERVRCILADV